MPKPAPVGSFPNNIQRVRASRGLTLEELADRAGTTHATVGRLEKGQQQLTSRKVAALSRALRCHPGELFAPLPERAEPEAEEAADIVRQMTPEQRRLWLGVGKEIASTRRSRRSA